MVTTQTTQAPANDPWASAQTAKAPEYARNYFGQMTTDAYYCILQKADPEKGIPSGKFVFDPHVHSADQRRTNIKFALYPLPARDGRTLQPVEREFLAESKEWTQIIRPSLDRQGLNGGTVNGKWVQIELVKSGTYNKRNADGTPSGEIKDLTTIKLVAVYADEAACHAAQTEFFAKIREANAAGAPAVSAAPTAAPAPQATVAPQAAPAAPKTVGANRETAAKFLPLFWNNSAAGDPATRIERFTAAIAANALTQAHFDINSPEVMEIITKAMGDGSVNPF